MDSLMAEAGTFDSLPEKNQQVLQEMERELYHKITRVRKLVASNPGSIEEYRSRFDQLNVQSRKIEQKLRLWCSHHVEFCPLLDAFTKTF